MDSGIFVSSGQLLLLFWQYRGDGQHVAGEYEITPRELGGRNVHGWFAADTRCAHTQGTQNTRQYVYNVDLKLSGAATTVAVTTAPGDSATTVVAMKKQTLTSDARRSSDTGLLCRPHDTWKEVGLYLLLEMMRCVPLTPEECLDSTACS